MNLQLKTSELPPFRPLPQRTPAIDVRKMSDGTVYNESKHKLGTMHRSIAHLFRDRALRHPERNFIAERTPLEGGKTGDWRFITYGEAMRAPTPSRRHIGRVILMAEPPSVDGHEITDKGYVNQRATIDRRKVLVDKLFAVKPEAEVVEIL